MTSALSYQQRRAAIEAYFDATAMDAWAKLTSDAPVGRIRATVRAGRDEMRATLLSWLPQDLRGKRVLDAGCGTGALAVEAARRGADVVAIDLSPNLVDIARARAPKDLGEGRIEFRSGDMLDPALGAFDYMVGMDSLIHYATEDAVRALEALAPRIQGSMVFTFAPRTPLLAAMHWVGGFFPRSDRSPAIVPTAPERLDAAIRASGALAGFAPQRTRRVASGFYISQALEVARA
jgi:magnesium-protoporphyrin O-methyltransferase